MSENNQSNQQRFLIAAVLSLLVLMTWSYFFAPPKQPENNANTAANTSLATNTSTGTTTGPETSTVQPVVDPVANLTTDQAPNRTITIKTPLYQVKLDSKGAVATSWILLKNVHREHGRSHEQILYAEGSTAEKNSPLELISPKGLETTPREVPFRMVTGDSNLDAVLNERSYNVSVPDDMIQLNEGESIPIEFTLGDGNGYHVVKKFVFHADSYVTDLGVNVTRGGQTVPNTKLQIGPSIGDQAIVHHSYYLLEPEAVAFVNGDAERYAGIGITDKKENPGLMTLNGTVDWVGTGDTYFAMAAIPSQPAQAVEFRASKYEIQTEPFYDGIIAWITRSPTTKLNKHLVSAYIPIPTDGSVTKIYTGSKDYFTLNSYSNQLQQNVGRAVNLDNFINWGWTGSFTKPIAIPLLRALNWIYSFVGNYGIAIVIFTFIIYSLFFPIRWYQSKSFKKAQANAPKMKEVQDRLKELQKKGVPMDDPRMREVQMEQLRLMKGAVPIGGCLPLLLQMPLFIAIYVAVTVSLDFRQASFLWLPDLSAGDPYHLLEFLFAGSMAGSMILTPMSPAVTPEQQMQQRMMTYLMPLMMLWVMWGSPAGLLLYWFLGNIVSFLQQFVINRMNKSNEPPKEEPIEVEVVSKKAKPKYST